MTNGGSTNTTLITFVVIVFVVVRFLYTELKARVVTKRSIWVRPAFLVVVSALLIALALEPGHVVPKATLVDWIWGENPPPGAANALQRLASRLRKVLPEELVEGQADGYRLTVEPEAVDAVRFERLLGQARADSGPARVRLLREALALWRGAAMQDVGLRDSAAFDAAVTRLEGLRLTALEDRFDAEISLGHGAELVTELTDLVVTVAWYHLCAAILGPLQVEVEPEYAAQ